MLETQKFLSNFFFKFCLLHDLFNFPREHSYNFNGTTVDFLIVKLHCLLCKIRQ